MSLASLAAAATVYDTIEEVAKDSKLNTASAEASLKRYRIASVSPSGVVTMSEQQSFNAAWIIETDERISQAML